MDFDETTIEEILNILQEYDTESQFSFPNNSQLQLHFEEFCRKTQRKSKLIQDWQMVPQGTKEVFEFPQLTAVETRLIAFLAERHNVLRSSQETFERMCRFCLTPNIRDLSHLSLDILEVSERFFQIRIFDGWPQFACLQCLEQLNSLLAFSKLCESSHLKLLEWAAEESCSRKISDLVLLSNVSEVKSQMEEMPNIVEEYFSDHDAYEQSSDARVLVFKNGINAHTCNVCSKSFKTKFSLKVHVRSHTNERPFMCPDCKMSFKTLSAINNHRTIHSKDKKFKCLFSECTYRTTTKANLKIHERSHSQERRYACTYCSLKFSTTSNLSKHIKNIHQQIKPHKCTHCGKTFFTKESARKHEVIHSKLKPYPCPLCTSKSYAWYNGLQKHMKSVHSGVKTDTEKMYFDKIVTNPNNQSKL